ncbi:DNA repair protein REV1 isoform X2 [Ooceraea biroi]|uniref:DNA repair protein REV1 isoform X2 n=1 Tax=Ooceraea biroi TaxID=2015173 RepID=UPI000F0768EF|nr:DNA repair protein REV1 isoform X2 [Ooceraea biroi]
MSRKKRNHGRGETGFEHWGGYMSAKKAKLEEQFHDTANKEFKESSKLFEGIAIFVNGYTDPTSDELRRLMMMHGGTYHHYMRPKITTHVIASNLPYSKIVTYRKSQNPIPICTPKWITASITAGKILNFQDYLLYSNSSKVQPQLTYTLNKKHKIDTASAVHDERRTESSEASMSTCHDENNVNNVLEHCATNDAVKRDAASTAQSSSSRTGAQSTRDAEFLSAFYSNSRLHYIATMGTTFKNYVNELRDKSDGAFPGMERLTKSRNAKNATASVACESDSEDDTICFRSDDKGLPVAVTHARGNAFSANYDGKEDFGSLSEVASCSYAARKAGVKNGMFLGEALKLCPNLKTIQYDFEGYKEVSYVLYDTVASYTLDIEAVSCDEMYADCTKILEASGLSALEFATIIREEIKQKTRCPVSTGFGSNKLQARLATRKAKPDNQFYLTGQNAETYIRTLNVRDLPGVGGTTTHKLHEMNVRTCEDLQKISLGSLQKEFGGKTGEQLHKMCRGLDDTKLNLEHVRKSVSAEVNYGIRFRNNGDAIDFLNKLSTEVCNRLTAARAKGRCITLKLMIRAEEAPRETAKFMGHGPCNYLTKSKNLIAAVDDVSVIRKEVVSIWNQLHLTPEDMRGIGIQISRLEVCKTKQNKDNLMNFFNKMEKSQPRDGILANEVQCDSNFSNESKPDKISLSTKSSAAATSVSDARDDNNLPLQSAQLSESVSPRENGHVAISDTRERSATLAVETKDKNLHNRKASENKSNKKAAQRQTSQENFFRHTKPKTGNSSKYEVPRMQDIDMSVLVELPEDIRNEILDEYKRNKKQSQAETANSAVAVNEVIAEKSSDAHDCSQVDPDVLSALMKSNLHPDVQRDVQMYCEMKREANRMNLKETNEGNPSKLTGQSQQADPSAKIDYDGKSVESIKNGTCTMEAACTLQKDAILRARGCEPHERDTVDETRSAMRRVNQDIELSHNNAVMDKADTFILQNLSILHNNENVDKHQEMLINLVNHLFTLPLHQVKMQIQTWVTKSKVVNEVDFLSLATFLSMLPQKKRIEDLHVLLKTMHRCTMETENCIWHRTYRRTVKHVQRYMQIEYNNNLMVPSIRCNDSRCNN